MKKLFIGLSLAAATLFTSCSQDLTSDLDNTINNPTDAVRTITVTVDNNESRIHMGSENDNYIPLYWSEGDALSINGGFDSEPLTAEQAGGTSATFSIPAEATGDIQVIYPADACNGTAHFYLDSEIEYNPTKLANAQPVLMGFLPAGSNELMLKHMCGYLRVQLTGSATVTKVMLRTLDHKPISGFFKQTITAEQVSMIDYNANGLADGYFVSPIITINCGQGVALSSEATAFDFAIPAGNYNGFALTIIDSNNKQQTVAAYKNGKQIEAGVMTKMAPLTVNCTDEVGVYDANAFIGYIRTLEKDCWLDNNNNFNLRADISLKDFNRSDIVKYQNLIYFRSSYTTYNNDDLKVWDGHDFTISDYSATITTNKTGAIFNTIEQNWTVQNLKIGKSAGKNADCVFTFKIDNTTGYNYASAFSCNIKGKVINCTNNATTKYTLTKGKGVRYGTFSANDDSTVLNIESCTNNGEITYTESVTPTESIQIGGIASRNLSGSTIKNCTNNGNITITSKPAKHLQIGGITGESKVTESGHTNSGNITVNGTSTKAIQVGGIHGYSYGVSNSTNSGKITSNGTDNNDCSRTGGIVGSLASGSISECHNLASGSVTSKTNYNGGWNSIGGIVGYGSGENNTPNKIKGCTNKATIEYTGTGKCRMGGITGMTGEVSDCTNYGSVKQTNESCSNQVFAGGIGGTLHWNTTNTHNYGDVSMVNGGTGDAGGFAGYTTKIEYNKAYTNCSVDCTVTAPKANNGGIFFGYIDEANITLTSCKAYGKVVLNGTENVVSSSNIATLIFGENKNGKTIDISGVTIESTKSNN